MKTLIALAAFALAAGTVGSQACDYQHNAANATPIVVATTEQPTTQQPAAKPEAAAPQVTTTDTPQVPPVSVADGTGGCSGSNC
jgi:hypothetical protein